MSLRIPTLSLSILLLAVGCASQPAAEETPHEPAASTEPAWETLFDGSSTDAFRAYKREDFPDKGWIVSDGALKTVPGGDVVDLVTMERYDDFELSLEWKVSPGGNSGVMYNVSEDFPASWQTGPEYQVLDDEGHEDGKNPKTSAAALYALIAPEGKSLRPVGEFNEARILVKGNHVEHWLNGAKVVEYELGSPELTELIAGSKFAELPRFAQEPSGHIALQHHGQEVWFRNIKIRRLAAD